MKISNEKKEMIREMLQMYVDSIEIDNCEIEPVGYREYDLVSFSINLDVDVLLHEILNILEVDEYDE
jgi:hypothetical protein